MTDNLRVDYVETGEGPPILFIPGSFSTPTAWRAVQKCLPQRYRFVATSLPGYGATADTRRPGDSGIDHHVRAIETVAARIGEPFHLVAHSFGGTVALAAALSGRIPVLSIATFEANPLDLLRASYADRHNDARRVSRDFAGAHRRGEADAAGRIIDYWGGTGSFAAMPEPVRDYCRATAGANVLDWDTAFGFGAADADLHRLSCPVLLVRGARANPAMAAITGELAGRIEGSRLAVVADAGHFLITTHPSDCAALLAVHLDAAGA